MRSPIRIGFALCLLGSTTAMATDMIDEDSSKFFLFHQAGVSTSIARADLSYCIDQSKGMVPFNQHMIASQFGLLGGLMAARMQQIDAFRMRNAAMRKCMALHGYDRYQVPSTDWKAIVNRGDIVLNNAGKVDPDAIGRMAEFAAGPQPAGELLQP